MRDWKWAPIGRDMPWTSATELLVNAMPACMAPSIIASPPSRRAARQTPCGDWRRSGAWLRALACPSMVGATGHVGFERVGQAIDASIGRDSFRNGKRQLVIDDRGERERAHAAISIFSPRSVSVMTVKRVASLPVPAVVGIAMTGRPPVSAETGP